MQAISPGAGSGAKWKRLGTKEGIVEVAKNSETTRKNRRKQLKDEKVKGCIDLIALLLFLL